MIDEIELKKKQAGYETERRGLLSEIKGMERLRKQFLKRFPISSISKMTLDDYCLGLEGWQDSFCYWVEKKLKSLGDIHGSTAHKFGVYYGRIQGDPYKKFRFTLVHGENHIEAFDNVKKSIQELLKAGKTNDEAAMINNKLSTMFRGKILFLYYPDKYLNIFSDNYLDYYLDELGIKREHNFNAIVKRRILMEFKNKDKIMKDWTTYEYSHFLYTSLGKPLRAQSAPSELKAYSETEKDYPALRTVKPQFIEGEIEKTTKKPNAKIPGRKVGKPVDFEVENRKNKAIGNRGEDIVMKAEKAHLKSKGKTSLADKVKKEAGTDDSLGYDILSFDESGDEKYIEVKSTNSPFTTNVNFHISDNQYKIAKKLDNKYYFYIVFNVKSKSPEIWMIKNPMQYESKGLDLSPTNYRVSIQTKKVGGK